MAKIQTFVQDDDAIKQSYRHKLYVEGSTDFDVTALKQLFATHSDFNIEISQLGKSDNVFAAAKCLFIDHPSYYFLIDRDFADDKDVEDSWQNFPNPSTNNLLIWRKRELENYFIDFAYISKSRYIKSKCNEDIIKEQILKNAKSILYSDVTQRIISTFKTCAKKKVQQFLNKDDAIKFLAESMAEMKNNCTIPSEEDLINKFNETLNQYTDGSDSLEYGKGNWINLISGKEIMLNVFNNCFDVKGDSGQIPFTPRDKNKKIVEDLLKNNLTEQPSDFQELIKLIPNITK